MEVREERTEGWDDGVWRAVGEGTGSLSVQCWVISMAVFCWMLFTPRKSAKLTYRTCGGCLYLNPQSKGFSDSQEA